MLSSALARPFWFIFLRASATSVHVGDPRLRCLCSHASTISIMHCCGLVSNWPLMSSSMEGGRSKASPRSNHMGVTSRSCISKLSRFTNSSGGKGEKLTAMTRSLWQKLDNPNYGTTLIEALFCRCSIVHSFCHIIIKQKMGGGLLERG